jgi:hypothetical protein
VIGAYPNSNSYICVLSAGSGAQNPTTDNGTYWKIFAEGGTVIGTTGIGTYVGGVPTSGETYGLRVGDFLIDPASGVMYQLTA